MKNHALRGDPHIHLINERTGADRDLGRGSLPRWSPDGRRIACTTWKSREEPWGFAIIDVEGGERIEPKLGSRPSTSYQWAPNGQAIAVEGVGAGAAVLYVVAIPSGIAREVQRFPGSTEILDIDWSPDSRALLVSRLWEPEVHDEKIDLWLLDLDGRTCRLTETPDEEEEFPRWIDASHIAYSVYDPSAEGDLRVIDVRTTR